MPFERWNPCPPHRFPYRCSMIWMFTAGHKAPARFVTAHIMWVNFVEMQPPGALRFIPLNRPLWTPLEWNPSLFFADLSGMKLISMMVNTYKKFLSGEHLAEGCVYVVAVKVHREFLDRFHEILPGDDVALHPDSKHACFHAYRP